MVGIIGHDLKFYGLGLDQTWTQLGRKILVLLTSTAKV